MDKIVILIDSGIDSDSLYLQSNILGLYEFNRCGEIVKTCTQTDECGHGTRCASVIVKECKSVKLISIKILNKIGESSVGKLCEALCFCQNLPGKIINLSLNTGLFYRRYLNEVCYKLYQNGKVIIASKKNGKGLSYPAKFRYCIGVEGKILDKQEDIWFSKNRGNFCIIDYTPYLHILPGNDYMWFGKSNSYASAKVTGILAENIEADAITFKECVSYLYTISVCKKWRKKDIRYSRRLPHEYINEENDELQNRVRKVVQQFTGNNIKDGIRLLSFAGGLEYDKCYELLKVIECELGVSIKNYTNVSREDFYSIKNLAKMIEREKDE